MADDYFSLARLEQPQMMPEAPMGAGALAGMMYGQDKARQDQALQGAQSLAQIRAMLEQQAASENMAGATGRMADITRGNAMSIANLGNLNNDISTQADTSASKSKQAEIAKLAPFAMNYDPKDMSNQDKRDFIDDMAKQGVTHIGKRKLSDLKDDDLDKFDAIMEQAKGEAVNTPKAAQAMALKQQEGKNWNDRVVNQELLRIERERLKQEQTNKRAEISAKAKQNVAQIMADAKGNNQTLSQYTVALYKAANEGDEEAKETLFHLQSQQIAKATAEGQNHPPVWDPNQRKLVSPAVPRAVPFGGDSTGKPEEAPKIDTNKGIVTVGNKDMKIVGVKKNDKGEPEAYKLEDGTIIKAK